MGIADAVRSCHVTRIEDGRVTAAMDAVAAEAPLEVRLNGEPFSVIMRTPGADRDLVAGFLFSEGVLADRTDVTAMSAGESDSFDVTLSATRARDLPDLLTGRRQVTMNSSCGMCGRRNLASLHIEVPDEERSGAWTVSPQALLAMPAALREAQHAFSETGGLHAAGLFDRDGGLEVSAEDVGRHNAVDKLVGRMWLSARLPLRDRALFVSGRLSFEIVQKALLAGIPIIAAVSAPSSMAVDLGVEQGLTLVGFVRDGRLNIYSGRDRIRT
jgi:FdhD protein